MQRIVAILEYIGTKYHGWQIQNNVPNTIQYYVESALSKVANKEIHIQCAGRTDIGVHAINQVIHFDTNTDRTELNWIRGTNRYLPNDIRIKKIRHVRDEFHARFSAKSRTYKYLIYNVCNTTSINDIDCPVFLNGLVLVYRKKLNVQRIIDASRYLIGEHDFSTFRGVDCQSKSPMREIKSINIELIGRNIICISICANAFLMHMVRNIVGSLIRVGNEQKDTKWIEKILMHRKRESDMYQTVSPCGLYLYGISYIGR